MQNELLELLGPGLGLLHGDRVHALLFEPFMKPPFWQARIPLTFQLISFMDSDIDWISALIVNPSETDFERPPQTA